MLVKGPGFYSIALNRKKNECVSGDKEIRSSYVKHYEPYKNTVDSTADLLSPNCDKGW